MEKSIVFIVTVGSYSGYAIRGVFFLFQEAVNYIATHEYFQFDGAKIEIYETGKEISGDLGELYHLRLDDKLNIISIEKSDDGEKRMNWVDCLGHENIVDVCLFAHDEENAIKLLKRVKN